MNVHNNPGRWLLFISFPFLSTVFFSSCRRFVLRGHFSPICSCQNSTQPSTPHLVIVPLLVLPNAWHFWSSSASSTPIASFPALCYGYVLLYLQKRTWGLVQTGVCLGLFPSFPSEILRVLRSVC